MNIIKELRRIRQQNWQCPSGLDIIIRPRAINARKGTNLSLRLITLIRMLLSKQNFMKLIGPDPSINLHIGNHFRWHISKDSGP